MNESLPIVMYVDDELDNLKTTKGLLRQLFDVRTFSSPSEAIGQLPLIKPKVIVSDLKMPGMNGIEFLELAQQIEPNSIRIIVTGNSDEESVIQAIKRAGVFDFIKKPFSDTIQDTLKRAVAHYDEEDDERRKNTKLINPDLMEHPSWLHKIANQFREAFQSLSEYHVSDKQIESWSLLVHLAMSAEKRYYHNTQHLFDIGGGAMPLERLSILFHDVVYAQVDKNSARGMLPQIVEMIKPFSIDEELKLTLPTLESLPDINECTILYTVFGKIAGDVLNSMNGMNEFLSARVAQKTLGSTLSKWDMIKVLSCIELTIPFRPKDEKGKLAPDRLLERLQSLNTSLSLGQHENEIVRAVERAVDVTNRDLWGFGSKDPGEFLNGSWKLILEGNLSLQRELHTPKDYRDALGRMEGFISFLKPEIIFQRIGSFPNDKDFAALLSQCHYNLDAGRIYFRAKMLAMGVFEALDENAPIEAFRGDIESEYNFESRRLENNLDLGFPTVDQTEINPIVVELLKLKSGTAIKNDFKNSPLALYFYTRMKKSEFETSLSVGRKFFKREIEGFDFFKSFPKGLICSVLDSISRIATSRQIEILQIKKLLESATV